MRHPLAFHAEGKKIMFKYIRAGVVALKCFTLCFVQSHVFNQKIITLVLNLFWLALNSETIHNEEALCTGQHCLDVAITE